MGKKSAFQIESTFELGHGPFEVTGFLPNKLPVKREFHRHDYYEILFFEKGGGRHIIDFNPFPVHDYTAHFVLPGQVHKLERGEKSSGYVLLFDENFLVKNQASTVDILLDLPFYNQQVRTDFFIAKTQFAEIKHILEKIAIEEKAGLPLHEQICGQYITLLLHLLNRCSAGNKQTAKSKRDAKTDLLIKLKHLLEKNYAQKHKPAFYAEALHISPGYLNEIVKEAYKKTSTELIQERLLLESRRLLFFTNKSVNEIAYALGFEDPAYFSRLFKKVQKSSPVEYREMIRKKSN